MATRFGGVSPVQSYATKVRWLVACLVTVIVILAVAVITIARSSTVYSTVEGPVPDSAVPPMATSEIEVLYSVSRIESGTQLEEYMFQPKPLEPDKAPMGAVRLRDRDKILGKWAKDLIEANTPLTLSAIADQPPINPLSIPPGYRAVTITVDPRSGVEGFAKPNSRVDVLWTYLENGDKKVATIVRFCKVLSVAGSTVAHQAKVGGATTVTLLVTERDAKKIELAMKTGEVSLSLVGDKEPGSIAAEPDTVTRDDLVGRPAQIIAKEEQADGIMYTQDPKTGAQLRYVLVDGKWKLDRGE